MFKNVLLTFFLLISFQVHSASFVSFGGYAAYPFSSQGNTDGGLAYLGLDPMVSVGAVFDGFMGHKLLPEIGYHMRIGEDDGYSKSTLIFLLDLGYPLSSNMILRYGVGWFHTMIGGDGAALELNNGTSTATFYRPDDSVTAYNVSLNLGIESQLGNRTTWRLESYIVEFLDTAQLDVNYALTVNYFLN